MLTTQECLLSIIPLQSEVNFLLGSSVPCFILTVHCKTLEFRVEKLQYMPVKSEAVSKLNEMIPDVM